MEYTPGSRCTAKVPSADTRTLTSAAPGREKTSINATATGSHGSSAGQVGDAPRSMVPMTFALVAVAAGWDAGCAGPHATLSKKRTRPARAPAITRS